MDGLEIDPKEAFLPSDFHWKEGNSGGQNLGATDKTREHWEKKRNE